jgi:tetratricopeptide (TPR) repeat protein
MPEAVLNFNIRWIVLVALVTLGALIVIDSDDSGVAAAASGTALQNAVQPITKLFSGMGNLHHPIGTNSAEAQAFFDQGLTFYYAFNSDEAARSFKRASELDSSAAMPFWGIALSLVPSYNSGPGGARTNQIAYENLQQAKKLAANGPVNERDYINALSKIFTLDPKPDRTKLTRDYVAAARELSEKYPDDPDAAVLYAESVVNLHNWVLWTPDGTPVPDALELVSVLDGVLRRWPDHAGANHFYIHALEGSADYARALPSAKRLETLVPAAGHLVHMPSHIYMRTGDYAAAVKSNVAAIAADTEYFKYRGSGNVAYRAGYFEHNYLFLLAAAEMDGDYADAQLAATQLQSDAGTLPASLGIADQLLSPTYLMLVRFARWDDALSIPAPDAKIPAAAMFWHYARGCAHAAKGNAAQAKSELAAMENAFKTIPIPGPVLNGMMMSAWAPMHRIAAESLRARISAATGDLGSAITHWGEAVAMQDQIGYAEPPAWYYPVRESLGAALLRDKRLDDAEKVFREDLRRNPNNPRSLFGLWKTLEAEHKTTDAESLRAEFLLAWHGAQDSLHIEDF